MSISDRTFVATVTFTVPGALIAIKPAAARDRGTEEVPTVDSVGGLFAMMVEYQKLMSREARADRELLRADEKLERDAKAAKLDLEKAAIDQMTEEAGEQFDRTMCAATTELMVGTIASTVEAGSAGTTSTSSSKPLRMSDLIQMRIRNQEEEIEKAARRVAESRDVYEAARERKQSASDSIRKFLDTLRSMNPQL